MHTIQYIAVQADDTDMAFRSVKYYLENLLGGEYENTNTWYDWFVTGGGRWSSDDDPYNDEFTGDVVHQSSPKFQEYLSKAKEFRQTSLMEYVAESEKIVVGKVISDVAVSGGENFKAGMELYPVKKIYDMAMGVWDYNSYFFDIINDSANMIHMLNSIENGAKDWFLVPCDMHF